jgi:sulfotransferase family protein
MTASAEARKQPRACRQRMPDFFIVGQPKSGTTALYSMLRTHPEIFMPDTKEPGFLAAELQVRKPPRPSGDLTTLEDYGRLFEAADPAQRVGEATPFYLWSRTAPGRIAELQPDARIIATLREPASLLHSLHLLLVKIYVETEPDLRTAIALEEQRRHGKNMPRSTYWPALLMYSEQVRYVEQLRRYQELFPPEQLLVLIYDDFRSDNEATVRKVLRFLDVRDTSPIRPLQANPTVRVRSKRLHHLVHAVTVGRGPLPAGVKAAVKALTPQRVRRSALAATQNHVVFSGPRPPEDIFMTELRRRFEGEVVALSEHLGRDLVSLWGYDRLS